MLILAISLAIPTAIAWNYQEPDVLGFGISLLICAAVGFGLSRINPKNPKMRLKSSIAIVVLSWLFFSLFGALPYYLSGYLSITDAVFETTSGFTTTGATIFLDIEELSKSILFWRSLTQWLGGMGIIVLSLAIMPLLGASGAVLYRAEVPGPSTDKLMPRLQATAKILWVVYVLFTLAEAILLKIFGMDWFDAFCHAFTTLSTGGFSTKNASIAAYDNHIIEWIVILFMFIGGANFSLHYGLFVSGRIRGFFKNREFVFYSLIIGFCSLTISYQLGWWPDSLDSLRLGIFQVVSLVTTTGYATANYELWGAYSQALLFLLLFVGGCGGSTGGGVKVIRIYVAVKFAMAQIAQVLHPNAIYFIKVGKTTIQETMIARVMGFIILYILMLGTCGLLLAMLGHDHLTSFSSVATCLGNVGPGFGEVGPADNFFKIHDAGKWILIFCMIAGRLELFTVLVLFSKEFWRK